MELSKVLPEDQRLEIEGRYLEMKNDWAGALGVYRHLWQDHPDDLECGLRLARVESASGDNSGSLRTLAAVRKLPPPQGDDCRIDLAEASVAAATALARRAASKAQNTGARLLLARARLVEGWALDDLSQFTEASASYAAAQRFSSWPGTRTVKQPH